MDLASVNRWLKDSYIGVPTLAGALVLGLLLLVFRDLDANLRARLVPSLAVYVLGTSLLAFVYSDLDARNCIRAEKRRETPGPQPCRIFVLFIVLHVGWVGVLAAYLFWKGVL